MIAHNKRVKGLRGLGQGDNVDDDDDDDKYRGEQMEKEGWKAQVQGQNRGSLDNFTSVIPLSR